MVLSQLSILSLNIQSLNDKIDQLRTLIGQLQSQKLSIGIINIQETWIRANQDLSQFEIEGFNLYNWSATCSQHSGVATYVDKSLTVDEIKFNNSSNLWESISLKIMSKNL